MEIRESVQEYYGKVLARSDDLKTNACCTGVEPDPEMKQILGRIHDDVLRRYYGCGLLTPDLLRGCTVLDLGCGSGRDVYVLSALVGEQGRVIGVDMTEEQLAVARQHQDFHREAFGYAQSNVELKLGYIEKLDELGLDADSIDIVVSNCVLNLSPDKEAVLREVYRVLKPGGEMYFSDVYADRRIPRALQENEVLWGECLSGALYENDFVRLARRVGFADPRVVTRAPVAIQNAEVLAATGDIQFDSITYRLWKIAELEDACEDYGQAVCYRGTVPGSPHGLTLDSGHRFRTGCVERVCGNTYRMLQETRFSEHLAFYGDWSTHYGLYPDCGSSVQEPVPEASSQNSRTPGGCC